MMKTEKFTVADKVYVDGDLVAEGNGMDGAVGCHPVAKANTFKVCGCNVKVVANLRAECQPYGKYTQEIGSCDCSSDACDEKSLSSGYTEKFDWHAEEIQNQQTFTANEYYT